MTHRVHSDPRDRRVPLVRIMCGYFFRNVWCNWVRSFLRGIRPRSISTRAWITIPPSNIRAAPSVRPVRPEVMAQSCPAWLKGPAAYRRYAYLPGNGQEHPRRNWGFALFEPRKGHVTRSGVMTAPPRSGILTVRQPADGCDPGGERVSRAVHRPGASGL